MTRLLAVGYAALLDAITLIIKRLLIAIAVALHLLVVGSILAEPLGAHLRGGPRFVGWRLFHDSVRMWGPGADFFAVYHAGINARDGMSVYRTTERAGGTTPYFYDYRYLPVLAGTLGRAVVALPPAAAYRAWVVLTEALNWLLLLVVFRGLLRTAPGLVVWLALVLATPFFLELYMGQFTFVAAGLAVLGAWMVSRRAGAAPSRLGQALAGVLLLCSIVLKIFPALTLAAWVRRRRLIVLAAAVGLAAVLLVVPGFLGDPRSFNEFRDANALATPDPGNFGVMHALFLTAERLGVAWTEPLWARVVTITTGLMVGLTVLAVLLARRRSLLAETALLLLVQIVISFQVWEHHVTAAMLAGALLMMPLLGLEDREALVGGGHGGRSPEVWSVWALAALMVWLALPTPYVFVDPSSKFWSFPERMLMQWSKALPVLAVYVLGLAWLLRDGLAWPWRSDGRR